MKIGIFCSAKANIDPEFVKNTEELGKWAGQNKHTIVFGGCNMGLMECIAKATREAGGHTIGVIPQIIERGGKSSDNVDIVIPCDNLSDRKDLLLIHSDIVVALPGGIGTLDEVFTVAAAATIGYHSKKVVLYNIKNFWSPLINMLDTLQDNGMIRGDWHNTIQVADNFEDLKGILLSSEN